MGEVSAALAEVSAAQVGGFFAVLGAIVVFARVVLPVLRSAVTLLRRTGHFLDDWFGEPDRPGVPGRPGVPQQIADLKAEQGRVSRELRTNGGSTVKDAVKRIESVQGQQGAILGILVQALAANINAAQHAEIAKAQERAESHREAAAMWNAVQAAHESEPPKE